MKNNNNERLIKLFEEVAEDQKKDDEKGVKGAHLRWAFAEAFAEALRRGYQLTDLDSFKYCEQYTGDYWKNNINELNTERHQKKLQEFELDGEKFRENVMRQIQKKNKAKVEKENNILRQ